MSRDRSADRFAARWQTIEAALEPAKVALDGTIRSSLTVADSSPLRDVLPAEGWRSVPRLSVVGELGAAKLDGPALEHEAGPDLQVLELLGEGGTGQVHLARQRSLSRDVAIKTLKPTAPTLAQSTLLDEALTAGGLEHPGIVPVHQVGVDERGHPLLVMKRVEGVEWRTLIESSDHPAWSERGRDDDRVRTHVEILIQLCNAVEFAHDRQVVHRDIKPENVMLGRFGEVYLLDWGAAIGMAVPTGPELVGTPIFMAPEQAAGKQVDARTDVYLLGGCLHAALTGRPRHEGEALYPVLLAAFESVPIDYPDDVPRRLGEIANRATARDPEARFSTVAELRSALSGYLQQRGAMALVASARRRLDEAAAELSAAEDPKSILHELDIKITEALFGFEQAAKQWSGPAVVEGREQTLALATEVALQRENPDQARSLLARMASSPAELVARIDAIDQRLAERAAGDARWRQMSRDLDPSTAAPGHRRAVFAACIVAGANSVWMMREGVNAQPSHLELLAQSVVMALVISAAVAWVWRRFAKTLYNRRVAGFSMLLTWSNTAITLAGIQVGLQSYQILGFGLIGFSIITWAAVVGVESRTWPAAVLFMVGAAIVLSTPTWAVLVFNVVTLSMLIAGAGLFRRLSEEGTRALDGDV